MRSADTTPVSLESAFPVLSVTASSVGSVRGVSNRNRRSRGGLSVSTRPANFDYSRYLASREWAILREAVRERSSDRCEHCLVAPQQAVHHLTYERIGHEELTDLMAVCNPCHEWFSGKSAFNPASNYSITPAMNPPCFDGSFRPWHYFIPDYSMESLPVGIHKVMWAKCPEQGCYWCSSDEINKNWLLHLDDLYAIKRGPS